MAPNIRLSGKYGRQAHGIALALSCSSAAMAAPRLDRRRLPALIQIKAIR
jgi:hypothetical protein